MQYTGRLPAVSCASGAGRRASSRDDLGMHSHLSLSWFPVNLEFERRPACHAEPVISIQMIVKNVFITIEKLLYLGVYNAEFSGILPSLRIR